MTLHPMYLTVLLLPILILLYILTDPRLACLTCSMVLGLKLTMPPTPTSMNNSSNNLVGFHAGLPSLRDRQIKEACSWFLFFNDIPPPLPSIQHLLDLIYWHKSIDPIETLFIIFTYGCFCFIVIKEGSLFLGGNFFVYDEMVYKFLTQALKNFRGLPLLVIIFFFSNTSDGSGVKSISQRDRWYVGGMQCQRTFINHLCHVVIVKNSLGFSLSVGLDVQSLNTLGQCYRLSRELAIGVWGLQAQCNFKAKALDVCEVVRHGSNYSPSFLSIAKEVVRNRVGSPSSCPASLNDTYELLVARKVVQNGTRKTQSMSIKDLRVSVVVGGLGVQSVDFIHSKKSRRAK